MTDRELLLAQGFHTYDLMSAFHCSSFGKGSPRRNVDVIKEQAGDTMNLNVMVVILYCQLCVMKSAPIVKLGQLQALRRMRDFAGLVDLAGDEDQE